MPVLVFVVIEIYNYYYGETLSRLPGKVSGCDVALNIN
jgi:hypothetical protein